MPKREAGLWKELASGKRLALIAGPCVIESEKLCLKIAGALQKACAKLDILYIFKASFDKANRSSIHSQRGPGLKTGLAILSKVRSEFGLPLLTDIHTEEQATAAGETVDILQIPAFLCRQTDLLTAAARTGRIINIKKGQFLAPWDMKQVANKAVESGNRQLLLTERGASFGYNNLVADMRAIPILKELGFPVFFDATHAVQLPGAGGDKSGGQGEFAPVLARCAVAAGADGLFIETHPEPDKAMSDGPNMARLAELPKLLGQLARIREALIAR
jgi:2-dehydro-3-deoxyphosphooctonate aldolase (KDO 8-P synthase)